MIENSSFESRMAFWICGDDADKPVKGHISWNPIEGAVMTVPHSDLLHKIQGGVTIFGYTEERWLFTVYNAVMSSSNFNELKLTGGVMLKGAVVGDYNKIRVKSLKVRFDGLDDVFDTKIDMRHENNSWLITCTPEDTQLVYKNNELTLTLEHLYGIKREVGLMNITKKLYFRFVYINETSFKASYDDVNAFRSYLSFLCDAHFDSFVFEIELPDAESSMIDICEPFNKIPFVSSCSNTEATVLFRGEKPTEKDLRISARTSLISTFSIESLGEFFGNFLREFRRDKTSLSFYFSALASSQSFHQQIFMELIHGLEGFDRGNDPGGELYIDPEVYKLDVYDLLVSKIPAFVAPDLRSALKKRLEYGNQISLRKRIRRILNRYQCLRPSFGKPAEFADSVTDYRNALAHPASDRYLWDEKSNIYVVMMFKVKLLFQLEILRSIGFSESSIEASLMRLKPYQVIIYNQK